MAYRRRQQVGSGRADLAFDLDSVTPAADSSSSSSSASSLAAKAIRASAAYRDSSLSSVYEQSALSSPRGGGPPSVVKDSSIHEHSPKKNISESRQGFWGVLAQKAKSILDDEVSMAQQHDTTGEKVFSASDKSSKGLFHGTYESQDGRQKKEGPKLQKGLNKIASSLNYIGGTIGNALEEGITKVENRTADILQETRKIQIRKRSGDSGSQNQASNIGSLRQHMMQRHVQPQMHADLDTQLKASRDVSMAMAAKAKLLLRELKTVKADLAFAKERCHQLEEENKILRESHKKGGNLEDDDLKSGEKNWNATIGWQAVRSAGQDVIADNGVSGHEVDQRQYNNEEKLDFEVEPDGSLPFYILDAHEEIYGANAGNLYLFGKI